MPTNDSPCKELLDAGLKTLLAALDPPKWLKAPATFVAELSNRFGDLSEKQKAAFRDASDRDLADVLLQVDLATKHAARAAAGAVRVEEQVVALRAAVDEADAPIIIKFPGTAVTQDVAGDGNIVVGSGSVNIARVDMRRTRQRSSTPILPGTVATDPYKGGYLKYLAKRFNEFKDWEVGREAMNFARIYKAYERELKFSIANTPLDRFDEAAAYLQRRVRNSKVGRIKAREGNRLFQTFEEFVACRRDPDTAAATT